jgi:para-aminobenzoate synthetase / 4-amino-4-deoxychorismate lyase
MVRLTFAYPAGTVGGCRSFRDPRRIIEARTLTDVIPALAAVEAETTGGAWAAGFLTYEAAPAFDPAMAAHPPGRLPLVWFGIFDGAPEETPGSPAWPVPQVPAVDWRDSTPTADYCRSVARIHEAIHAGATYQVNYTTRLTARLPTGFGPHALFETLRRAQGVAYHALLELDDVVIVSASPELFFARSGTRVTVRPMKGTRPRGRWAAEDDAHAAALRSSEKERAENLMIVDLVRSDLGRIARIGSVRVPRMFEVERYPTVFQMTSTVEAEVRAGCGLVDAFRALFPCGSVTGAPKISTMRMIAALEDAPREVYCGAIGIIAPGGDCTFSVPIRTVWLDRVTGEAVYGVGSGITADARAEDEARELHAKAALLRTTAPAFSLLETMRLEDRRIVRLDRHLDRIRASCAYFGRPFPEAQLRSHLTTVAAEQDGPRRVRLTVEEDGTFAVDTGPLPRVPADTPTVALADGPVDDNDVFLFHKTNRRSVYTAAARLHADAFDVLLWNIRGEATEFTRGNLVVAIDGALYTPPIAAGLLAGCMRAELLDGGCVAERVLTLEAVRRANRLWFVNSLRGWIEVRLAQAGSLAPLRGGNASDGMPCELPRTGVV